MDATFREAECGMPNGEPESVEVRELAVVVADLRPATSPGSVVGRLELQAGGVSFPESGWTDFVLPVLGFVVDAFVAAGSDSVGSARFMEGPFSIRFESAGEAVRIEGQSERQGMRPRIEFVAQASRRSVKDALRAGLDVALSECQELGLESDGPEVSALQAYIRRLERVRV